MSRNYVFAANEYYHLYARGFEKSTVYRDRADYERFIEGLYLFNSKSGVSIRDIKLGIIRGLTSDNIFDIKRDGTLVDIGAYCLMNNHFHILVREKDEEGKGISKFMQKLITSYTMYFNKKHERTGAIFGASFKAQHVTDDKHLKYLLAYIHLNPVDVVGEKELSKYQYSSYPDYISEKRTQKSILNFSAFPNYFDQDVSNMRAEIEEWISINHKSEV